MKKLTKQQIKKEMEKPSSELLSLGANGNTLTSPRNIGSNSSNRKQNHTARMSSQSKKRHNNASKITFDSFEGVKDGVANRMHCDPHSTTSNLALQTINFPGSNNLPTIEGGMGMNQYLTLMNTHPLL